MSESQEFTKSYNQWISADSACETYAAFIRSLKDKRAGAITEARLTPEKATPILAALDGQLAASVEVARGLWLQRMIVYSAHRQLVKERAQKRAATKVEEGS